MHLYIISGAQLEWKGAGLPCPLLKIEKSAMILEKKAPDCVHLWVKFSIQTVVLRVFRSRNSKIFSCRAFYSGLMKCLSKCPNFTKPPLPWKISCCAPASIFWICPYLLYMNVILYFIFHVTRWLGKLVLIYSINIRQTTFPPEILQE